MSDDHDSVDSHPGNNGKAPDGKFAPGNTVGHRFGKNNRYGKGNPIAVKMHAHRVQFLKALDPRVIPALVGKLSRDALGGDLEAAKVLLGYALGRPQQPVELTGADGEPLGLNVGAVTTVVLNALSGEKYTDARVKIAAQLMKLDGDARDDDAAE